jgi:hypothetical protein
MFANLPGYHITIVVAFGCGDQFAIARIENHP